MPYKTKHRTSFHSPRIFLACLFFFIKIASSSAFADTQATLSAKELRQKIDQFARAHFSATYNAKKLDSDLIVNVGAVDSRLKLARCDQPISLDISTPNNSAANSTVRARCEGAKRWSIFVPVNIEIYSDAIIASIQLNKGDVITPADVETKRINTARQTSGYFEDVSDVAGMQVARRIRAGEFIKPKLVRAEQVVKKGQSIQLKAKTAVIVVAVNGVALQSGAIGEQIKVKNTQSKRIVHATIVAAGIAEIII